ncbi:MAG: sugar transferase [Alistipes sp.]|nr:sugar transferase [Alistipes sp.]
MGSQEEYAAEQTSQDRIGYELGKRVLDVAIAAAGIIFLSPLFLVISVIIICQDGHFPIYVQERVGKNGRTFKLYKFRSMTAEEKPLEELLTAEELECYRREYKLENDPRVTKFGKFIRKISVDELPQLFNIVKGDLSFIGPRPVTYEETLFYGRDRDEFLSVKPGLTGYWQAYARNNADYASGRRQAMELYYVRNRGAWLDLKVFFKTFEAVWRKTGV